MRNERAAPSERVDRFTARGSAARTRSPDARHVAERVRARSPGCGRISRSPPPVPSGAPRLSREGPREEPRQLVDAVWPTHVQFVDRDTSRDLSLIHISEPTRLLSISYAVFCLKKKK